MKSNAREYLIEFASSQENWFKSLIYEAIETNGAVTLERVNEIFKNLRNSTEIQLIIPNIEDHNIESEIHISKLTHRKGVNALKENQTIKFSHDITILYGMNGAGKSGYFKVLNEIVGGNQRKNILPNIYSDNNTRIDVEVCFEEVGKQSQTINWDSKTRSLPLLNKSKVFDTSYLNGLLDTRKTDTTLIQPLGLHLFTYIVDCVDKFKAQLITNADKKRLQKPIIDLKHLSELNKSTFTNHNLSGERRKNIEKLFVFSDENVQTLEQVKKEIETLKQVNIQDKIKLYSNNKREFEELKNSIIHKNTLLLNFNKQITELIPDYKEKVLANKKTKEQFDVLNKIPSNDTQEWKSFIIAGDRYSKNLDDSEKICAYCRQPLKEENSINIIKSYGLFLKDNSEQELERSIASIISKKKEIEHLTIEIQVSDNISQVLKEKDLQETKLYNAIIEIGRNFVLVKNQLIDNLNKVNIEAKIILMEINSIVKILSEIISELGSQVDKFSKEDSEKKERIKVLDESCVILLENESVSKQKDELEKWFEIHKEEDSLRKKASSINTRQLSILSKTAHDELLTKSLMINFNEELKNLGYKNLYVSIDNANTSKGEVSTKLVITKNRDIKSVLSEDIKSVLSEGEQKAVALALFIAEIRFQKTLNPIFLDDPVNSLDHQIASNFAERLLKLENQIIIFNHNKLFLDAFETSKENHICKTIDSDCCDKKGKHIRIYQIASEGVNAKGVLSNYKSNRAKSHIDEAKKILKKSPFDDSIKVAVLLRKSVECTIDEVVFNNQVPTKHSNKNSRIAWAELKKVNGQDSIIDTLERIHGRASGGEIHNGDENRDNPIVVEEFNGMINDIEEILNKK
jgi:recombinational DNA repair ATPase RecF